MNWSWIKRHLPRRLYSRAVLILLVPIVALQLIVGFIIIQRHFDGVTQQLARGVARELKAVVERVETMGELDPVAIRFSTLLGLGASLSEEPFEPVFRRNWWDRSGLVTKSTIEEVLDRPVAVDLVETSLAAIIRTETSAGVLRVRVSRARVSARNPQQLLILTTVAAVLLTIISLIFLKNQVRPIRELAAAAEAFGKGRATKFHPAGAEEVRRAGTAFLAMRNRIERQIEQRTLMLSGVSHDLRTPLTRIRLALATAETVEDLEDISGDLDDMEQMLDGFLAFARERGSRTPPLSIPRILCAARWPTRRHVGRPWRRASMGRAPRSRCATAACAGRSRTSSTTPPGTDRRFGSRWWPVRGPWPLWSKTTGRVFLRKSVRKP